MKEDDDITSSDKLSSCVSWRRGMTRVVTGLAGLRGGSSSVMAEIFFTTVAGGSTGNIDDLSFNLEANFL